MLLLSYLTILAPLIDLEPFGPRVSGAFLYTPYSFELGVDLESKLRCVMLGIFYDSHNNESHLTKFLKELPLFLVLVHFRLFWRDHSIGYGRTGRLGYSNSTHCL